MIHPNPSFGLVEPPTIIVKRDRRLLAVPVADDRDGLALDRGDVDSVPRLLDKEFDVFPFGELFSVDLLDARRHYQRGRAATPIRICVPRSHRWQPARRHSNKIPRIEHLAMPAIKTACSACDSRVSFITEYEVEILLCPECGQEHKVSERGAQAVLSREERHQKLRDWDEEVLQD